ncbi:LapA family protein [Leifsonia poae]|uniref:LapA family protein n=1 Tax=Leifsonia poae TaxID=110933 RepID=UPI003D67777D
MSADTHSSTENGFVRFLKRKWFAILLVVLLVVVAIQNGVSDDKATIFFLWAELTMPTWLLVLIIFIIGGVVGWIFARNRAARRARR